MGVKHGVNIDKNVNTSSSSSTKQYGSSDSNDESDVDNPYVGGSPMLNIEIVDVETPTTPDTGSQVTTVEDWYFEQYLKPVLTAANEDPVQRCFHIRSSNNLELPYQKYFVADIRCNGHLIKNCGFLVARH